MMFGVRYGKVGFKAGWQPVGSEVPIVEMSIDEMSCCQSEDCGGTLAT
jgi:hypothetical protein